LLLRVRRPDVVLVQSPPAFPALALSWLAARLRSARLIVDWHNLTHSMLALRLDADHRLTRFVRRYEAIAGRAADGHLCVSRAMADYLRAELAGREAHVLYDRPAAIFAPLAPSERSDLRRRLLADHGVFADRPPAILVSSTSWTADEDFDLLLEALSLYDRGPTAPLFVLVTGDGPRRAAFEERARARLLRNVYVRTAWVRPEEYPRVLAAADAGVCLHRSASGLDLPMKLADMAGAGLPVCAFDYGVCLSERFRDGYDGLLFKTADELAAGMRALLGRYPIDTKLLDRLRDTVARAKEPPASWDEGWEAEARALFVRR
jgi:beta-1,4-mannosyltransferase